MDVFVLIVCFPLGLFCLAMAVARWRKDRKRPPAFCLHVFEHVAGERRLLRDQRPVQLVWEYYRRCLTCGQFVPTGEREWEYLPGGREALDAARQVLRSLNPNFDNSGSGCRIYFPPLVAIAHMTGGPEAGVMKARALLGMSAAELQATFDP